MKIFDMNNLWVIRMIDENFSFFFIGFDKTEAIEKANSYIKDTSLTGKYKVEQADENTAVDCDYIVC